MLMPVNVSKITPLSISQAPGSRYGYYPHFQHTILLIIQLTFHTVQNVFACFSRSHFTFNSILLLFFYSNSGQSVQKRQVWVLWILGLCFDYRRGHSVIFSKKEQQQHETVFLLYNQFPGGG